MAYVLLGWVAFTVIVYRMLSGLVPVVTLPSLICGAILTYLAYSWILEQLLFEDDGTASYAPWGLKGDESNEAQDNGTSGISLVFVHGLDSNPLTTWKAKPGLGQSQTSERFDWISSLLVPDLQKQLKGGSYSRVKVYFFNYESRWKYSASHGRLRLYGSRLKRELREILSRTNERVILIGHSFGGLVIKEALTLPQEPLEEDFMRANKIAGIVFLGTPHLGSRFALFGLLTTFALMPMRPDLSAMISLRSNAQNLRDLHENFITKCGHIRMRNFWESEPVILKILSLEIVRLHVVPETSATFSHQGTSNIALRANHMGLNKFEGPSDNYQQFLKQIYELIKPSITNIGHHSNNTEKQISGGHVHSQHVRRKIVDPEDETQIRFCSASIKRRMHNDMRKALQERHQSTCTWIEDPEGDLEWLKTVPEEALLWITGSIGCGKTTLCTFVIEKLIKTIQSSKIAVLYVLCNPDYLESEAQFVCILLDQLLEACPHVRGYLEMAMDEAAIMFPPYDADLYGHSDTEAHQLSGLRNSNKRSSQIRKDADFLWAVLKILIQSAQIPNVFLVIDGIDMLSTNISEKVICDLRTHLLGTESSLVKVIISNRTNTEHIRSQIFAWNPKSCHRVQLDDMTEFTEDVERYLSAEMARIAEFRGYSKKLARSTLEKAITASANSFLYANFIMKSLGNSSITMIDDVLGMKPGNLPQLYDRALSVIAPSVRAQQSSILLCLLYAYRPLHLSELLGAISGPGVSNNRAAQKGLVCDLMLYGPLIYYNEETGVVRFSHPTVKDYLLSEANRESPSHSPMLATCHIGHATLAYGCLRYMIAQCNLDYPLWYSDRRASRMRDIEIRRPGIRYAFLFWHKHCSEALSNDLSSRIVSQVFTLLKQLDHLRQSGGGSTSFWMNLAWECANYDMTVFDKRKENFITELSSVEFFSLCGIPAAVEVALEKHQATESQALVHKSYEMALQLSFNVASPQTIKILLNHFNVQKLEGAAFRNVIPAVVRASDTELFNSVLSMRPSRSLGELASALFEAVWYGDVDMVENILSSLDFVNEKDKNGMTLLHWMFWQFITSEFTLPQALRLLQAALELVNRGVNINAQDSLGNTILHYIAYSKLSYGQIFRQLVANGAKPDIQNRFGWRPIHLVVRKCGNITGLRYLDIYDPSLLQAKTKGDSSVLHWAVQRHSNQNVNGLILKYLLCRGLSLEHANRKGIRPLDTLRQNSNLIWELWLECPMPRSVPAVENRYSYSRAILSNEERFSAVDDVELDDSTTLATSEVDVAVAVTEADENYESEDSEVDDENIDDVIRAGTSLLISQTMLLVESDDMYLPRESSIFRPRITAN